MRGDLVLLKSIDKFSCPLSQSPLILSDDTIVCTDTECRLAFGFSNGIPNLLADDAVKLLTDEWKSIMQQQSGVTDDYAIADGKATSGDGAATQTKTSDNGQYDLREKYNNTGSTYDNRRYGEDYKQHYLEWRIRELVRLIKDHFPSSDRLDVLDIGCGTGVNLQEIVKHPQEFNLYGMDISQTMLGQAVEKMSKTGRPTCLFLGSAFSLPLADSMFDVVFATRFIHQFSHEDKKAIHSELLRVVKPGGIVIVEYYEFSVADWFENYLGRKRHKTKDRFVSKYPTRRQVVDITGQSGRVSLNFCGQRFFYQVFGKKLTTATTKMLGKFSIPGIINEYYVANTKSDS